MAKPRMSMTMTNWLKWSVGSSTLTSKEKYRRYKIDVFPFIRRKRNNNVMVKPTKMCKAGCSIGRNFDCLYELQGTPESNEDCLLYYAAEWKNYRWSSNVLNNVCRYLNDQKAKKRTDCFSIEQIAFKIWSDQVFTRMNEKVSTAVLEMLERNRGGVIINTSAIKNVVHSYIELGRLGSKTDRKHLKDNECLQVIALRKKNGQTKPYFSHFDLIKFIQCLMCTLHFSNSGVQNAWGANFGRYKRTLQQRWWIGLAKILCGAKIVCRIHEIHSQPPVRWTQTYPNISSVDRSAIDANLLRNSDWKAIGNIRCWISGEHFNVSALVIFVFFFFCKNSKLIGIDFLSYRRTWISADWTIWNLCVRWRFEMMSY